MNASNDQQDTEVCFLRRSYLRERDGVGLRLSQSDAVRRRSYACGKCGGHTMKTAFLQQLHKQQERTQLMELPPPAATSHFSSNQEDVVERRSALP